MTSTGSRESLLLVQVATSSGLGVFWKLLFRWKGSIYKLVWQNLLLYMALYYALSVLYRFLLDQPGRVSTQNLFSCQVSIVHAISKDICMKSCCSLNKYGIVQKLQSTFNHINSINIEFCSVWSVSLYVDWIGHIKKT